MTAFEFKTREIKVNSCKYKEDVLKELKRNDYNNSSFSFSEINIEEIDFNKTVTDRRIDISRRIEDDINSAEINVKVMKYLSLSVDPLGAILKFNLEYIQEHNELKLYTGCDFRHQITFFKKEEIDVRLWDELLKIPEQSNRQKGIDVYLFGEHLPTDNQELNRAYFLKN